jgi:hypothetical protein
MCSTMLVLLAAAVLTVLGQPWYSRNGNSYKSAYVSEEPLSTETVSRIRLRWQLTNISVVLAAAGVPNPETFSAFSDPLTPNLQTPGNDVMLLLINQFLWECENINASLSLLLNEQGGSSSSSSSGFPPPPSTNPCTMTYLAALNSTTGSLLWITPENITWSWPIPDGNGTFPFWAAGPSLVYVATEPGNSNFTLSAFDVATGEFRWSAILPYAGLYLGGSPNSLHESALYSAVYVILTQVVQAYSVTTGRLLWEYPLPHTQHPTDNFYTSSVSMLLENSGVLLLSYTAFEEYAGTTVIDLATGKPRWTNEYYMMNSAQQSVSTGFTPPASDGVSRIYFQSPITKYSQGIGVMSLHDGSILNFYSLDVNHNDVVSNFVAFPNGDMTCVYGADTDYANPSWIFNAKGQNASFYINGSHWYNANNCASFYGVRDGAVYAFCGGSVVAFTMPAPPAAKRQEAEILWSFEVNPAAMPGNLQMSADGQRYLGNGRFLVIGNNNNDFEKQWLRGIQMYF